MAKKSWLEWKDVDLNKEKWGIPKDGPDGLFLDAESVVMPRSLKPCEWIRAKNLKDLTDPLTVYTMNSGYPDLITNNKHLLHSEFVRWFISTLTNLQHCGRQGLEISGENVNFIWNYRYQPWYGWIHVYSCNKAGKGVQHQPLINPNGKYIVRLHCGGCWRRILIDDTVPVDEKGQLLLPCTANNYELWPILVAKALLKIASLTWTERHEIVDFHPIACLTGWIPLTLNIKHLSLQDKWDFLTKYTEHFEWVSQNAEDTVPENSTNAPIDKMVRANRKTLWPPAVKAKRSQPVTLFLFLNDTRELGEDAVPGLTPCWDHVIHVVQSRDMPLDPKDVKPPLAKWKMHRWLNWAISENLIDPADCFVPIRYLSVVSPLQRCNENPVKIDDKTNSRIPAEIVQPDKPTRKKSTIRSRNNNMESTITTTDEEKTFVDNSRWIDFNKMSSYVTEAHLFYKLEYFECSVQLTSNNNNNVSRTINENRKAAITREIKKADTSNTSPHKLVQSTYDEPLYLFCDSLEKKFLMINLCVVHDETNTDSSNKKKKKKDHLILERHDWFEPGRSDCTITVSTTGIKSTVTELPEGRQLLRIYRCCKEGVVVTIASDTIFQHGNRTTVQQLMIAESDRIARQSQTISDGLRDAYRSFGSKDYPVALREYYRSYMPVKSIASDKRDYSRALIHRHFMEEKIRLIAEIVSDNEEFQRILHSVRVFFLNPSIGLRYLDAIEGEISSTRKSIDHADRNNRAAVIIQSFFKMALVRRYKRLHDPADVSHTAIRKTLTRISELFDTTLSGRWFRNVIKCDDNLRDFYPCTRDFRYVLKFQDFADTLENIKQQQQRKSHWFPIGRFRINCRESEMVLAMFELMIDHPRTCVALRVFDNTNRREIIRIVNNVASHRYVYVPAGYTVFAYGWNEDHHLQVKRLDWCIRIITVKGESMLHRIDEHHPEQLLLPRLTIEELYGVYKANIKSRISQWILRVTSWSIVSLRLTMPDRLDGIRIKIIDERDNVLIDVHSSSSAILLPFVILEHNVGNRRKSKIEELEDTMENEESVYYMEAFLLNNDNSTLERTVINQTKTSENPKQSTIDGQVTELPYWILQVVTDATNPVKICQDNRREQKIARLKESWCSKDPDRLKRGAELRKAFLSNYYPLELESHRNHRLSTLAKYISKTDEEVKERWVKTETDDELLRHQRATDIDQAEKNYSSFSKNLTKLINEQIHRYTKLFRQREENFRKRRDSIDTAYQSRKTYIDSITNDGEIGKKKQRN